jgi:hypothetical protein
MSGVRHVLGYLEIQVLFLAALLAIVAEALQRGGVARGPRLSRAARQLLDEIRADTRSRTRGLTIFSVHGVGAFYNPFRWDETLDDLVDPGHGNVETIRDALDELGRRKLLSLERSDLNYQVFRLRE